MFIIAVPAGFIAAWFKLVLITQCDLFFILMKFKLKDRANHDNGKPRVIGKRKPSPTFLRHYESGRLPLEEQIEHKIILRRLLANRQTEADLTQPSIRGAKAEGLKLSLQNALRTLLDNRIVQRTRGGESVYSIAPDHLTHVKYYLTRKAK